MPYKDREQQKAYNRNWKAARRASYLEDKMCVRCGSASRLEIDHVDPLLKVDHRIWSWSVSRREAELAKCQILCFFCHQEKTRKEDFPVKPFAHGTMRGYCACRCRCDVCREWMKLYKRERRALSAGKKDQLGVA